MTLCEHQRDGVAVVECGGEMTLGSPSGTPAPLHELVVSRQVVAVSLAGVTEMDSFGLGQLIDAIIAARGNHGRVIFFGLRGPVYEFMRLMPFGEALAPFIRDGEEDAIDCLRRN